MSDTRKREDWGQAHRIDVKKFKVGVAVAVLAISIPMVIWTVGVPQYLGVGMASIALWRLFPDSHQIVSGIVDRLPFLRSKRNGSGEK